MSSLAYCFKRIGDKLSAADKKAVKAAVRKYRKEGYKEVEANATAIEDLLKDLEVEKADIMDQIGKAAPAYQVTSKLPWPKDFPNAIPHTTLSKLTGHKDYESAKAGDTEAALRLVDDLINIEKAEDLAKKYPDAAIIPVLAREVAGDNKIPAVFAQVLSDITGLRVENDVIQNNLTGHTTKTGLTRLLSRAKFEGKVTPGQKYIIVDDAIAQGGTIHELRHYIDNNGGETAAVVTFGFGKGATVVAVKPETIANLERKFGRAEIEKFLNEYNVAGSLEAITEGEARYLLSYKSVDSLRERFTQEGYEPVYEPGERPVEAPAEEVAPEFRIKPSERAKEVGLSLKDIQAIFRGHNVLLTNEGHIYVHTKKGHGLLIKAVNQIAENRVAFEIGYERKPRADEVMVGKYVDGTIELRKDLADKWTLYHELEHWAEDIGLLQDADIRALNAEIRAQKGKGIGDPVSKEDRAAFVEKSLEEREKYRDRGHINRILQKIQDFLDALINIANRTARGVVRGFEAGTVFRRKGVEVFDTTEEDIEFQKEALLETHRDEFLDDDGNVDTDKLEERARRSYEFYYSADELDLGPDYERGWSIEHDPLAEMAAIPGEPLEVYKEGKALLFEDEEGKYYIKRQDGTLLMNKETNSALFDNMKEAKKAFFGERIEDREGMPLYKAIPPEPVMGKQAQDDYERDRSFANRIFEQRDVGVKEAEHETQQLQKEVQRLAGVKSIKKHTLGFAYDRELKRSVESDMLDMAMMVYRDLQINPAKAKEYRDWADKAIADPKTPKSQKIQIKENLEVLDRALKLTEAQKDFVDKVGSRFDRAFRIAKANKVVQAFHNYYVRRVWNLPKGKEDDFKSMGAAYGFKTFTTARLERKFETILDGWMAGYDLSVKGLTNSYGAYVTDLEAILANKDFIFHGYTTRDADNRRMFSTSSRGAYKDYAPLKAPGFKVWEWAGKAETEIAPDYSGALIIDDYGRKFFFGQVERIPEMWAVHRVQEDGTVPKRAVKVFFNEEEAEEYSRERSYETTVRHRPPKDVADAWERRELYAPKQLATIINKMTQGDQLFATTPALETIGRLNAGMKAWLLLSSFFHHIAGGRSWGFAIHHGWRAGRTVIDPITGESFVTSGWNPVRAYKEGLQKIEERSPIITLGIKNGLTLGELQDWSELMLRDQRGLADRFARHLGMEKVSKGITRMRFHREKFTDSLFKKYFAGLKAEAFVMEYVHELQKVQTAHLEKGTPAPDTNEIAEQVARLINADFGGLHLQRMGRNPTLQKMMRLLLLAPDWTESNFRTVTGMIPGLNQFISKMIGDVKPPPGMDKIYRKFWGRVVLRIAITTVITQLLLNGTDESEEFWREQALTSRFRKNRWLEVDITSFYNALGIDTEGKRKTFSIGGHFFDPLKLFDPARLIKHKGSPIVRVIEAVAGGADWRERPFVSAKELIMERKTVKESPYAEKEQFFDRLPAAAVNVVTNLQPVQVGYAIRYLQGEDDGLSSLMRGAGMQVHTAYPAKIEGPMARTEGEDEVYEAIQDLIKGEALTMGPPSRRITIGGISHKMTPAQYSEYWTESSDLARVRLLKFIGSEKWKKLTNLQRAAVVEKLVRSSRKRARAKLKRRDFKIRYPSRWSKEEENLFLKWYEDKADKWGLNPDPDDPKHHYDYRRAYRAGVSPDSSGHWPSKFKRKTHPRRIVKGVDTITGRRP